MAKARIKLPPLVLDGEAKVLHRMTLRELHVCLTRALRVAGGDSLEESGRSVFSIMQQPDWWPPELPFDAKFTQKIPPENRSACYRHLLSACYSFYKQDDVLHLFDSRSGEPPRWRLVQEGDNYTIFNRFTEKAIWTYSTNFQILPLITLSARQNEQYRASLGEQLKKSKTDLVIRTRSQKANAPPRQRRSSDVEEEDRESDDGGEFPMSPRSRQLLSPDGSPRRISIMNRLSAAQRMAVPEIYGGEQIPGEQPSELRCRKCNSKFGNRFNLMEHLIKFKDQRTCDESAVSPERKKSIDKELAFCSSLKIAPRKVIDDYKAAVDNYAPKSTRLAQRAWKPQFIGCQLPLSSELGRRLFQSGQLEIGADPKSKDFLSYERYCGTRHLLKPIEKTAESEKSDQTDGKEETDSEKGQDGDKDGKNQESEEPSEKRPSQETTKKQDKAISSLAMDGQAPTASKKGGKKQPAGNGFVKFYPVDYRPRRIVYHMHTYKFTMAERRLYDRMQQNGGLSFEARALLKRCEPVTVELRPLTEEDLENHGVSLDESDEETESGEDSDDSLIGPPGPRCSKKKLRKTRRRVSRAPIVTRSQNQRTFCAARALAMVRKKYWPNSAHMRKRIGGTVLMALTVKKRSKKRRKQQRRSCRGLVPRRRFSLVEEFAGDRSKQDKAGSSSMPSSPMKLGLLAKGVDVGRLAMAREKRFTPLIQGSTRSRGRPRREHRLPARYRTPSSDEAGRRQKQKKLLPPPPPPVPLTGHALPSTRIPVRLSPQKPGAPPPPPFRLSPRKESTDMQVASLVAKILRTEIPEPAALPSATPMPRKPAIHSLSAILPKGPSRPEPHAPPPYSMQTSEHVYVNLGGHFRYAVDAEPPPARLSGRFMVPRPLSPGTEERIRETIDEVVEAFCMEVSEYEYPIEAEGLQFYNCDDSKKVKTEMDDEDAVSRCSSESTIVSAIFEVPPSSSDDEDEVEAYRRRKRRRSSLSRHVPEAPPAANLPAAKRLKMSFSEICATPQPVWPRPSALGGRKPTILGGRLPLPASPMKTVEMKSEALPVTSAQDAEMDQSGVTTGGSTENHGETEKTEVQNPDTTQKAGTMPETSSAKTGTVEATALVQKGPVIVIPTTASSSTNGGVPIVTTISQQISLGGRMIRVPVGCRLVTLTPKNMPAATQDSSNVGSATISGVTARSTIQVPIGTMGAIPQPIRSRIMTQSSSAGAQHQFAVRTQSQLVAVSQPMFASGIVAVPVGAVPIGATTSKAVTSKAVTTGARQPPPLMPAPNRAPARSQVETPSLIHFKCNICGVKLTFPYPRAYNSIEYHMKVAHKNATFQLRKLVKRNPVPSVHIEAVRCGVVGSETARK